MEPLKSVAQLMEMLEYLAARRAPASAADIGKAIGCSRSIVITLLASLIERGFIAYDPLGRRYAPSVRLGLLGASLRESVGWARSAESLHLATGHAVGVLQQNGLEVQVVLLLTGEGEAPVRIGDRFPLVDHPAGVALLARMTSGRALKLLAKSNGLQENPLERVPEDRLIERLRASRAAGLVVNDDAGIDAYGCVATVLPAEAGHAPLALAVYVGAAGRAAAREALRGFRG